MRHIISLLDTVWIDEIENTPKLHERKDHNIINPNNHKKKE